MLHPKLVRRELWKHLSDAELEDILMETISNIPDGVDHGVDLVKELIKERFPVEKFRPYQEAFNG